MATEPPPGGVPLTMTLGTDGRPDSVTVIGAGIAGSWVALLLAEGGLAVTLCEADGTLQAGTSFWAGGMLAPDCEGEGAEPVVVRLGRRSLALWRREPSAVFNGSLVVAHGRDRGELIRFERQTTNGRSVGADEVAALEPALAGRFASALFFADEGHVEPRLVLRSLHDRLRALGVTFAFGQAVEPESRNGLVIDCRGLAARDALPDLRGVRGETITVATDEIALARPVRVMHPRWPLYVIPRPGGRFLIGATSIESEDRSGVSVRSALELLSAAYALHPAFGEARILELGTGLRPAFPDNAPRVVVRGRVIAVNGLYRHGYLMAPALAEIVAGFVLDGTRDNEVMRWS